MAKAKPFVRVGQIVGAHGLKGQVKVQPLSDFFDYFEPGSRLRLNDTWVEVKEAQVHKNRLLLKLVGISDRNQAEALQWAYLEAQAEEVELEEDEYRADDLVGLHVFTTDGEDLGKVQEVLPLPAQDVLQVGTLMIPLVKQFIKNIDLDQKRITVELIPGMREP